MNWLPYVVGGAATVSIVAALFFQGGRPPGASDGVVAGAPVAEGAPPDLSQMSPRERFDRLFNRIMQASESGDTATVRQFTPMAVAAYGMLDLVDDDARYHAAMIRLQSGDPKGASALADTILIGNPRHLLGLVIQGSVARWHQDPGKLAAAQRNFLAAVDGERATGRQEYRDHQVILDRFRDEAKAASGGTR